MTANSNQCENEHVIANSNHSSEVVSMAKDDETFKRKLNHVASQVVVAIKKTKEKNLSGTTIKETLYEKKQ